VDDRDLGTSLERVFAGGDAVLGPASAIEAIGMGKKAAGEIDRMLSGRDRLKELRSLCRIAYGREIPDNERKMVRQGPDELPMGERFGSFDEVVKCFTGEQAVKEAGRCFRCDLSAMDGDE